MHVGDTVEVDGTTWALVKTDCGHAGSSSMFIVHRERGITPTNQQQRLRQVAMEMAQVDEFHADAELADQAHRRIINLPLYDSLKPQQLRDALELCRNSDALLRSLVSRAYRMRRVSPDVAPMTDQMLQAMKEIGYQHQDLLRFWHHELLDPADGRGRRLALEMQYHRDEVDS
jgi:hypothetical protein